MVDAGWENGVYAITPRLGSNLALDVNSGKRFGASGFKPLPSLPRQEDNGAVTILQKFLAAMVENELCGLDIGLKIEFLRDEP